MYFDGTRVFDYTDPDPHARGHIGLCVWLCVMRFERMRLYRFARGAPASAGRKSST